MKVTLSAAELGSGAICGMRRRIQSLYCSRQSQHGLNNEDSSWDDDIGGAIAELVIAKALNVYWEPHINVFAVPDVGQWWVRYTRRPNGRLIIRECDKPGPWVLVRGPGPSFEIAGWVDWPSDRNDEHLDAPNGRPPAWFIPSKALRRWPHDLPAMPANER